MESSIIDYNQETRSRTRSRKLSNHQTFRKKSPLSVQYLVSHILPKANLPAGTVQVLLGDGEVVQNIVNNDLIQRIDFTAYRSDQHSACRPQKFGCDEEAETKRKT